MITDNSICSTSIFTIYRKFIQRWKHAHTAWYWMYFYCMYRMFVFVVSGVERKKFGFFGYLQQYECHGISFFFIYLKLKCNINININNFFGWRVLQTLGLRNLVKREGESIPVDNGLKTIQERLRWKRNHNTIIIKHFELHLHTYTTWTWIQTDGEAWNRYLLWNIKANILSTVDIKTSYHLFVCPSPPFSHLNRIKILNSNFTEGIKKLCDTTPSTAY